MTLGARRPTAMSGKTAQTRFGGRGLWYDVLRNATMQLGVDRIICAVYSIRIADPEASLEPSQLQVVRTQIRIGGRASGWLQGTSEAPIWKGFRLPIISMDLCH